MPADTADTADQPTSADLPETPTVEDSAPAADTGRKSAATLLVEMAQARFVFGISDDGEPFAVPRDADPVTLLLRGGKRGLRAELARLYFRGHGKAAPQQALATRGNGGSISATAPATPCASTGRAG